MNTIQDEWDEYRAKVISPDVSEDQLAEMKRVFYAGVYSMLGLNMRIAEMPASEEALMLMLHGLRLEVEDFFFSYAKAQGVTV